MARILKLVFLLIISQVALGQAPSNYTNINGRYRWIAGMFDSTFHIPKGTTPSLRTGGSTNAGALFYKTGDSSLYVYSGTQWLKIAGASGFVPYVGATQDVDLDIYSLNAKSLHVKGTGGNGHLGLKFQSATPNMSANESGVYADASGNLGVKIDNLYTSIFKTSLNSADRTYTLQNKSYTIGDSADIAARVKYTDTASMLSPYLRKIDTTAMLSPYLRSNVAAATYVPLARTLTINGTTQDLSANRTFSVGTVTSVGITAGTGISVANSPITGSGNITVTNTAPDQTVALTGGTGISISGTYPNFTITNSSPSSGGTVTSVATNTGTGITGGTITSSGTIAADTLLLSTRAWRQKGVDSVAALITGGGYVTGSGTATRLAFWNGTSSLSSNANLYWDNSNSRLGVGTASPLVDLQVQNASLPEIRVTDGTVGYQMYSATGSGVFVTGTYTNHPLVFRVNASEQMRLTSTGLGIGTSSPAYKLDVNGTVNVGTNLFVQSDALFYSRIRLQTSASYYQAGTIGYNSNDGNYIWAKAGTSSNFVILNDGGSAVLTLSNSGNLGLGVTPSAWSSGYIGLQMPSGTYGGGTFLTDNGSPAIAANAYNNAGWKYVNNDYATIYQSRSGQHQWYTAPSGTAGNAISFTQAMTLDASGNLLVGGTTNPYSLGRAVFVHNSTSTRTYFQRGVDLIEIVPSDGTQPNSISSSYTSSGSAYKALSLSGRQNIADLYLGINGNVGIGTTSPAFPLEVYYNSSTAYTTSSRGNVMRVYNPNTNANIYAGIEFGGAGTANDGLCGINGVVTSSGSAALTFYTRDGGTFSERMRITSGGYLGIGTSAPLFGLSMAQGSGDGARIGWNDGGGSKRASIVCSSASDALQFHVGTSDTERMRITSSGELLIGTSTANSYGGYTTLQLGNNTNGSILNFQGGATSTSSAAHIRLDVSGTTVSGLTIETRNQSGTNSTPIVFKTQESERMRITSGGELLINTTSDAGDYKLQVNGNSYLNGITKITKSVETNIVTKTATYTLTSDDYTVVFDAASVSSNLTANLPDATTCTGRIYTIYSKNNPSYNTTVDGNGSQTINGSTTYSLSGCDLVSITIQSDGSNWIVISQTYGGSCY